MERSPGTADGAVVKGAWKSFARCTVAEGTSSRGESSGDSWQPRGDFPPHRLPRAFCFRADAARHRPRVLPFYEGSLPEGACAHLHARARARTRTSRRCFLKGLSAVVCFVPCGHLAFCELHLESVPACPSNVTGTGKVIISIRTSEFGLLLVNLTVPYIY